MRPTGLCPSSIMIIGEFPSELDLSKGSPFEGGSGYELGNMLKEAGIFRSACFMTNVLRIRPPANDITNFIAVKKKDITPQHVLVQGKWVLPVVRDGLEALKREIEMCRPNVIIALGNTALWALTGAWSVSSWRGSVMACTLVLNLPYAPKIIPTYHPSMVMRQWDLRQIVIHDLRRAKGHSTTHTITSPEYSFIIRPDFLTTISILEQLHSQLVTPKTLSIDIETRAGHIACIGLAWSTKEALCIPLMCMERVEGYWPLEEEASIVFALYQILQHPNCEIVGQNFSYDAQYIFRHWHFLPSLKRDTMLAQHAMFSNMPKGLDFLSSMYCDNHLYWKDEGKTWDAKTGEEQLWEYNCKDAVITFEVDIAQQSAVDKMGLREVHDFQQALYHPVLQTMNYGIKVDFTQRSIFATTLQTEIMQREQWFVEILGHPLNPRSGAQMKALFYDELNLKPITNRKTGAVSCDDESIQKLAEREPLIRPLVNKISEIRSLGVFYSTFVQAPVDIDGRIRCSFNIGGTETYRFSSSKNAFGSGLNLQNIPKGGETSNGLDLPNIRSLFIPDKDKTFFDIDLASADLRIVVWEADEQEMKALLKAGLDPYTEIAKEFYNDPTITKKDPRRQLFKSFAHGTNYLGTAEGLAGRLGLTVKDAERTQKWYFERFPKIKIWQNNLKDSVVKKRMVQNVFGYRCYFFDRIEGTIFNQAAAWIPQSTVACLINRAYLAIYQTLPEVEILLQVHDSLAGQFPTSKSSFYETAIVKAAEIELPYAGDPLIIPIGIKISTKSWGDCD